MITLFKRLTKYLKPEKYNILISFVALLITTISILMLGQLIRRLIDNGITARNLNSIDYDICFLCLLAILIGLGSFIRASYINNLSNRVASNLRKLYYQQLLKLSIEQFEKLNIGEVTNTSNKDIELVSNLIVNLLSFIVRNSLMLLISIIFMFYYSTKLSCIAILSVSLLMIIIKFISKYVKLATLNTTIHANILSSNFNETFLNIRTIFAYNRQEFQQKIFDLQTNNYLTNLSAKIKVRSIFFGIIFTASLLTVILMIWLSSLDVFKNRTSGGEIIVFLYYLVIAGFASGGIIEFINNNSLSISATKNLLDAIELPNIKNNDFSEQIASSSKSINFSIPISIYFDTISFYYPSRLELQVLENLNLNFTKNFNVIVGSSGSGKSTILQLLLKFYTNYSGKIVINNHNLHKIKTKDIRSIIGYVSQDTCMFSGSIASNIAFSKPDLNIEKIEEIALKCQIMEFANSLPDGLNTEISHLDTKLSGGQKQRIALARALIHNPQILLLDEATNALDIENEQKLLLVIKEIMKDKIIIAISHRSLSIKEADEVFFVDHGKLIANGTNDELIKSCLAYRVFINEI